MQLFLDTANIEDIKKYASWGVVDGVTTNPSLIAKEGVSFEKRIKDIAKIVNGPISAEVTSEKAGEMLVEARKIAKWHKNVFIKLPMTAEGLKACKVLSKEKIPTNMTLVFSLGQALLAAKAGATLVSPFIGRLDDISQDGMALIEEIVIAFTNYGFKTKVLVASVRHPRHVMDAALIGADICTIPPEVFEKLVKHPLTDKGLEKFMEDWKKGKSLQKK